MYVHPIVLTAMIIVIIILIIGVIADEYDRTEQKKKNEETRKHIQELNELLIKSRKLVTEAEQNVLEKQEKLLINHKAEASWIRLGKQYSPFTHEEWVNLSPERLKEETTLAFIRKHHYIPGLGKSNEY